jgi:hypothetical protein
MSISRLEKEPRHLADEQTRVTRDMETLAVDHYRSFVESSRAVTAINQHVNIMDHKVDALVQLLPTFTDAAQSFVTRSEDIRKEQKLNRLMSEVNLDIHDIALTHSLDMFLCNQTCCHHHTIELVTIIRNIRITTINGFLCTQWFI